jgi:NADH:ubiquinone reductase (non-electrogenic)
VIAIGASNNTFNIPGVTEHAVFMKELVHSRIVRTRIVELFEMASIPSTTAAERQRLLHFVVVGGTHMLPLHQH